MKQRSFIALAAALAFLIVGTVGVYAYDHARDVRVAEGITVGGVDIGGMSRDEARTALADQLTAQLNEPVWVVRRAKRLKLDPRAARVRADVDGMVDDAIDRSREGNVISRAVRAVTGGDVNEDVPVKLTYSRAAVDAFVERVEDRLNRPARDARISYSSSGIEKVRARKGLRVVDSKLRTDLQATLRRPGGDRTVTPAVSVTSPKVSTGELASKYPDIIVVCRKCFQLRYYKNLKLKNTYRIAVGQQGLETPAGLYDVQTMQVNPSWHVPNSDWAGKLAGRVIPPGPENPLKARWIGFNGAAGIHGTDAVGSLGTAASHGCIRMAVPAVIELYKQVDVGDPVYIG